MSNIAKWIAGAYNAGAWSVGKSGQTGAGFTSTDIGFFNSAASGSGVVASAAIANGTNLDEYGVLSFKATANASTTGSPLVSVYLLPLNHDGTTYGDGTASGALRSTAPGSVPYLRRVIMVPTGITAVLASSDVFPLPPTDFLLAVFPAVGTLAAAAAVEIGFRTFNENLNG